MSNIINVYDATQGKYVSIPTLRGASAYDVAVENGFEGTEKEWLDSLKGSGTGSANMEAYATKDYVDSKVASIDITDIDLDDYATKNYVSDYITDNIDTISNGYYEPSTLPGNDVTREVILNSPDDFDDETLPQIRTYDGGTRYIVSGGVVSFCVDGSNDSDETSLYLDDYKYEDQFNQKYIEINDTIDGYLKDYMIYGMYNEDLLQIPNMLAKSQYGIMKYHQQNGYYGTTDNNLKMCAWTFQKNENGWVNYKGKVSLADSGLGGKNRGKYLDAAQKLDDILSEQITGGCTAVPNTMYTKKSPCICIDVEPNTTYTLNFIGRNYANPDSYTLEESENDLVYQHGIHFCELNVPIENISTSGITPIATHHELDLVTKTFTTNKNTKSLVISISPMTAYGYSTDNWDAVSREVIQYMITNFSLVKSNKTYEYLKKMINSIPYEISITAQSIDNANEQEVYLIKMPRNFDAWDYIRLYNKKDVFKTSRLLEKAILGKINTMEDSLYNYNSNEVSTDQIGTWINGKPIYRSVFDFPQGLNASITNMTTKTDSNSSTVYYADFYTPIVVDYWIDTMINVQLICQEKDEGKYTDGWESTYVYYGTSAGDLQNKNSSCHFSEVKFDNSIDTTLNNPLLSDFCTINWELHPSDTYNKSNWNNIDAVKPTYPSNHYTLIVEYTKLENPNPKGVDAVE